MVYWRYFRMEPWMIIALVLALVLAFILYFGFLIKAAQFVKRQDDRILEMIDKFDEEMKKFNDKTNGGL